MAQLFQVCVSFFTLLSLQLHVRLTVCPVLSPISSGQCWTSHAHKVGIISYVAVKKKTGFWKFSLIELSIILFNIFWVWWNFANSFKALSFTTFIFGAFGLLIFSRKLFRKNCFKFFFNNSQRNVDETYLTPWMWCTMVMHHMSNKEWFLNSSPTRYKKVETANQPNFTHYNLLFTSWCFSWHLKAKKKGKEQKKELMHTKNIMKKNIWQKQICTTHQQNSQIV